MQMYRQGDVLIVKIDGEIPTKDQNPIFDTQLGTGRTVLAYGEVTGHAHAIDPKSALLFPPLAGESAEARDRGFLQVLDGGAVLRHEEHTKIDLPAGNYQVIIQEEYTPEGLRNVAD